MRQLYHSRPVVSLYYAVINKLAEVAIVFHYENTVGI